MKLALLSLILVCQSCQSAPALYSFATAPDMTSAERGELTKAIAQALQRSSITLGESAFADNHILVLTPSIANTPLGKIATSRTSTKPETLHLLSNGQDCVLEIVRTGARIPLNMTCRRQNP